MANWHRRPIWRADGPCTPEAAFLSRRKFIQAATSAVGLGWLGGLSGCKRSTASPPTADLESTLKPPADQPFVPGQRSDKYTLDRKITAETVAGWHNNFYEFTTDKENVWNLAQSLTTHPWAVEIAGEVAKPVTLSIDELVRKMPMEERLYRFRCVERWAMAVPWTGFPFAALLKVVEPTSRAKYVRFVTFLRPAEAKGQRPPTPWHWPYYEGLTIEEAGNELTMMATGIYGHALPKQHGAPLRLVVPWKYGYKSIKSIVRIELTEQRPPTFWNDAAPNEYDFWSNVNPNKPHPRWSQAREWMIGSMNEFDTMPYNGYAEFVHQMYKGKPWAAM